MAKKKEKMWKPNPSFPLKLKSAVNKHVKESKGKYVDARHFFEVTAWAAILSDNQANEVRS